MATPAAGDYNITNLTQTVGSVTAVSIVPKTDMSQGARTVYYNSSTTLPMTKGSYTVTFDVEAEEANFYKAATGLAGGTFTVLVLFDAQTPAITAEPTDVYVSQNATATFTVAANVADGGSLSCQ